MTDQKPISIQLLLKSAWEQLNSRIEAEILIAHVLGVPRSYLYTWPEKSVSLSEQAQLNLLIQRRSSGEPIAYLLGRKEFWSIDLSVSPAVLIPRPETELIVELVLQYFPKSLQDIRVLDLGTGSGAIALALAHECPHWKIIASDYSNQALELAKLNAKNLAISNIDFYFGDWFSALDSLNAQQTVFNIIVSNPPYIAIEDPHLNLGDLRYEPRKALVSGDDGLSDLKKIIKNVKRYLAFDGCVIVEHGYAQSLCVTAMMQAEGLIRIATHKDLASVNRVTVGFKA